MSLFSDRVVKVFKSFNVIVEFESKIELKWENLPGYLFSFTFYNPAKRSLEKLYFLKQSFLFFLSIFCGYSGIVRHL